METADMSLAASDGGADLPFPLCDWPGDRWRSPDGAEWIVTFVAHDGSVQMTLERPTTEPSRMRVQVSGWTAEAREEGWTQLESSIDPRRLRRIAAMRE